MFRADLARAEGTKGRCKVGPLACLGLSPGDNLNWQVYPSELKVGSTRAI